MLPNLYGEIKISFHLLILYFQFIKHKSFSMKKSLVFILLFSVNVIYGQFTKGTRTIGAFLGSTGFSNLSSTYTATNGNNINNTKNQNFNLSVSPSMGWFINENVLVGGNLNFNLNITKYTERGYLTNKGNNFTAGVGAFGRYYFGKSGFMPYTQVTLGTAFGSGSTDFTANYSNYSAKGTGKQSGIFNFSGGAGLGITKMLSKNTGLDLSVGYSFLLNSYKYAYEENRQYVNPVSSELSKVNYDYNGTTHGATISVGFLILLDPKK